MVRTGFDMSTLVIALTAIIGGLALVVFIVGSGIRMALRDREMQHVERIKALEVGRSLPGDESWWTPSRIAVAVGAGVPLGVILGPLGAVSSGTVPPDPFLWCAAGAIGVAGVICGSIQAIWIPPAPQPQPPSTRAQAKAPFDHDDAFDVAARRGGG